MRGVSFMVLGVLCACASGQTSEDCAALGTSAKGFAESKLDALAGTCSTNADCVLFRATLTCYTGCPRAIRAGRENSARADLDALSETLCGSSGCSITDGCTAVRAECRLGRCRTASGAAIDAGTSDGG